jgi:hypothetical protein
LNLDRAPARVGSGVAENILAHVVVVIVVIVVVVVRFVVGKSRGVVQVSATVVVPKPKIALARGKMLRLLCPRPGGSGRTRRSFGLTRWDTAAAAVGRRHRCLRPRQRRREFGCVHGRKRALRRVAA